MTKHDYTELDAAIVEHIRCGHIAQAQLVAALRWATRPLETENRCAMRVIDAWLQALRKRGKIKVSPITKKWTLA